MATPSDRCSKRNVLLYVAFIKPTERALCLLSSTTLPHLRRLFPKPTAYSSFGTKNSVELTFLLNCCYLANLHVRQTRALQYNSLCTEHSLNRWVAWNPHLPPSEGSYFEVFWNCCKQEDIFYIYICVYIYIYIFYT